MFDFNTFMAKVKQDNPSFKRFTLTSSLDPLIAQVRGQTVFPAASKAKVERLIAFMPFQKQTEYKQALAYLAAQSGVRIGAIPCNPVMKFTQFKIANSGYKGYNNAGQQRFVMLDPDTPGSPGPRSFVHVHKITWSSSNGNPASLATVRTREYVKFLQDTQAPPFNKIQDPDREFYAPGTAGTTGATEGTDDHTTKLPALICCFPRQAGRLQGEQWYQYSVDNGVTWNNIEGAAYLLEKKVAKVGIDWVFTFKKTNWAPHNTKPFHFEVEYTVGPPPEFLPRDITDVAQGLNQDADIKRWARRVVSTA
jgi:hypothetical protein